MTTPSKPNRVQALKQTVFVATVIGISTFLQIYWAVGQLRSSMSSSCLDCNFSSDAVKISLITGTFLAVAFFIFRSIKYIYLKIGLEFVLLSAVWLFWNYSIFVERESAWSTYLFSNSFVTDPLNPAFAVRVYGGSGQSTQASAELQPYRRV